MVVSSCIGGWETGVQKSDDRGVELIGGKLASVAGIVVEYPLAFSCDGRGGEV